MKLDRTRNTIRNTKWGVLQRCVNIILPFFARTILIHTLSAEYAGLSSLFTSILQILSLSELGISNAIVYSMYRPIADNDERKICALLNLYKKAYFIIGCIILSLGLASLPFLPFLIKNGEIPGDVSVYVLYLVYLSNTVISYFMYAYKTCLLSAYQREDVVSRNTLLFNIFCYSMQCAMLLLFRNYYAYAMVLPLSTIMLNILNKNAVDKLFPKYIPSGSISIQEKHELKKNILGIMLWKVGAATRNTFDSIVVSMYLGLVTVAMYNNYFYIITGVNTFLGVICTSMVAGVGNKIATDTPENNYKDFQKFHFFYMWLAGWCTICLMCLYQPFMRLWMGEKLMFPKHIMFLFCYYFIMFKQGDINSVYYQACGLWWYGKYRSIIEAVLNLTLNFILGKYFGVTGIILATIIALSCIYFYGSKFIFTEYFKQGRLLYHLETFFFMFVTFIVGFLLCTVTSRISDIKLQLIGTILICVLLPNIIFLAIYYTISRRYKNYIIHMLKAIYSHTRSKSEQ